MRSSGWIYNKTNNTTGLSAGTSYYPPESGTYLSAGNGKGYNDVGGYDQVLMAYASPELKIGDYASEETDKYGVNKNGQTFGTVDNSTAEEDYPDLVGAVGLDGTKGYVLSKELLYRVIPSSREEAVALMTDPDYIQGRIINLYASDGVTVIGKFLAGGLIGVTIQEDGITTTYNEDGTIVETYANGIEKIARWK